MRHLVIALLGCFLAAAAAACVPVRDPAGAALRAPGVSQNLFGERFFVAPDGKALPMRVWMPDDEPRAVIVALHGMNDYAAAFELPAPVWAARGLATYAIDQRGYGGNVPRGIWPGVPSLTGDFRALVGFVHARHPGVPVYGLGVSMGGAVVMAAMDGPDAPDVDGVVLVAPAVWGEDALPPGFRAGLWLAAHSVPSLRLTGQNLDRLATDNLPLLRQMGRDPRVQKGARVDAIYGLFELMNRAHEAAPRIPVPVLLLYGERDEIVARGPIRDTIRRLPRDRATVGIYRQGYHLLLRDMQRATVQRDVAHWILNGNDALPSEAGERDALSVLEQPRPERPPHLR